MTQGPKPKKQGGVILPRKGYHRHIISQVASTISNSG